MCFTFLQCQHTFLVIFLLDASSGRFHFMLISLLVPCSDASIPISSASLEDRKLRADIAASFQVMVLLCNFLALFSSVYWFNCPCRELQCYIWRKSVTVQLNGHWRLSLLLSIWCVKSIYQFWLNFSTFWSTPFFFCSSSFALCSLPVTSLVYDTDKLIHLGGLWRRCFQQPCEGSA